MFLISCSKGLISLYRFEQRKKARFSTAILAELASDDEMPNVSYTHDLIC
jgi:hypothetical protein